MTWSTCCPQPAHVVFPHVLHVTCLHIVLLISVWFRDHSIVCGNYTPGGILDP